MKALLIISSIVAGIGLFLFLFGGLSGYDEVSDFGHILIYIGVMGLTLTMGIAVHRVLWPLIV